MWMELMLMLMGLDGRDYPHALLYCMHWTLVITRFNITHIRL